VTARALKTFVLGSGVALAFGFAGSGPTAVPGGTPATDVTTAGDVAAAIAGVANEMATASLAAVPARVRYVLSPDGTEARYRVREQLARIDFPSDAVGATKAVEGGITIEDDGTIVGAESKITVDVSTLATDNSRRDNYVRRRTLETETHPTVVLVPTSLRGLTFPLPTTGEATFELNGELTIRGVTRATTWNVTARFAGAAIHGTAKTSFTFEQFEMTKPSVASVLSVEDDIRLELDFHLVPAGAGGA